MIVAALLALTQTPTEAPSAGPLISKMLARYTDAQTAQGSITTTQTAKTAKVVTETVVAIEKPNRLRIEQTRNGTEGGHWLVVSDGVKFSYDRPQGGLGKDRYLDAVEDSKVEDLYTAATYSLGEKSAPLDILIGRKADLAIFVKGLPMMALRAPGTLRGESVQIASSDPTKFPYYQMAITPDGDLRQLVRKELYSVQGSENVEVTTAYDVSVKVGGAIAGNPFRVE